MKRWISAALLSGAAMAASATQETFTDAGPLDCAPVRLCRQDTTDGLFTLNFKPAYPWSAPSPLGFDVREKAVEIRNANGGVIDLNIMSVSLTGSSAYNGSNFNGGSAFRIGMMNLTAY